MGQLLRGRYLERGDSDALGVDSLENVPDRAVLAARVHPLEHHQKAPATVRVEQLLESVELRPECGKRRLGPAFASGPARGVRRVDPGEVHLRARAELEPVERVGHFPSFPPPPGRDIDAPTVRS